MKKQFAVVGLGRFGGSVCKELYKMGHEVLAIDTNEDKVNDFARYSTHAVVANATDENTLLSLGIRNFEHVIVAIGDNIQASILCTLLLKELKVKQVWVKAQNQYHHKVVEKIGADRIIHPEHDMGIRIAHYLASEKIIDYIELSPEYSIVELLATEKVSNQTIAKQDIRAKFGCTILGIKRGEEIIISPPPDQLILEKDIIIIIGSNKDLKRFEEEGL
ncbi:potassium channel family protein [Anaerobacillus isosaccharinicus]|uniref:Potassium transporter Trk n=1 Tax=Anaerobacillus isosaccharinicus TaxID=1532552 RepID=A0A1S2KXW2_9BACI|nr:TrkA family potassium uptake protein [Anaerobacillus isosaccharinicus]MBA5586726.1 TrkA family potassium uptake protein [Anaerobacillus isosaccharinicus]QOY35051.1 TrkA family potassium uptake protein [Anaerobacillus isosaccharinicus]